MTRKLLSAVLAGWLAAAGAAQAQSLNQEMSGLADRINEALVAGGYNNVAALDFTDLQGRPTELGRQLSERLVVEIVLTGGVSVADRANIKSILAEHRLTEEGLVNPANARKLGEFAGVDAILTGTVFEVDAGWELLVRAISTESATIVAAGRISFPKTSDNQQAGNRGVSANTGVANSSATGAGDRGGMSYEEANSIATKDLGSLRVVLKSVLPMRARDQSGRSVNGIRCSFEFMSRETQRNIVVAMNAMPANSPYYSRDRGTRMGDVLRTTLVDERGTVWGLSTSDVTGMSIVSVGRSDLSTIANPAEIGSFLQRQDETGTNMRNPVDETGRERPDLSYAFVFGSTTQIPPGQSVTVTMGFVQDTRETPSGPPPTFFQLNSEIVVGVATTGRTKSYSLHNLMFDRVNMPAGGR